jgi:arsenate reductase (glutaredoxin)
MKIYHNPRCSKSRQALDLLRENNIEPEIIDYLNNVPTFQELKELIHLMGIQPEELIRKGESDFKDNFKGRTLSDKEWIQAMIDFPKLIERPIIIHGNKAVIGRPPEKVLALLW